MNNLERVATIKQRLIDALTPSMIEVEDESHLHAGHEGAKTGKGHFAVTIASAHFNGKTPLARHRLVYAALGDMMETDIHALRINANTPS